MFTPHQQLVLAAIIRRSLKANPDPEDRVVLARVAAGILDTLTGDAKARKIIAQTFLKDCGF